MARTTLNIKIMGDPCLRKRARKVETVTETHRKLLCEMEKLMRESRGIGLAAPQIGVNEAMIVVDVGTGCQKLVNPRIVEREGEQVTEEGCLSVPGVYVKVRRASRVVIEAFDEEGKLKRIEAKELLAVVFQHEIDHLHGKLICDYVSVVKKMQIELRMREIRDGASDERVPEQKRKHKEL